MRKTFLLFWAVMLFCFSAFSQEAELTVIPRVDYNARIPFDSESFHSGRQGSALYTLFEGTAFQERLSYSLCNHWLSDDSKSLYDNTWHTDDVNWLDWAYVGFHAGNFSISAGKMAMLIGGYEMDAYDFDSHNDLNTIFWNSLACYQWGGTVSYTSPSEQHVVSLQRTTSPFCEKLWDNNLSAWSLHWSGDFVDFSTICSANLVEYDPDQYISLVALGLSLSLGDGELQLDCMNRASSASRFFDQELTLSAACTYPLGEKLDCLLKGGYETIRGGEDLFGWGEAWSTGDGMVPDGISGDYAFGGCGLYYYPLSGSRNLKLHATAAVNNYVDAMALSAGVTYYFNAQLSKRR